MIYLDYNATTPLAEEALEAMMPYLTQHYGNAASKTHALGWVAADAVKRSRASIAETIGCTPQEIVFTSGATEAINLAMKGVAEAYARKGNHIITLETEHKAVLDVCKQLERHGKRVTYLPVDKEGLLNVDDLKAALSEETILVSVMLANNETGVIQPIREIAEAVHEAGALMMSDCVQAVGKLAVDVDELGIDLMPISAHKFYGPKGVGALYLRRRNPRVRVLAQIDGGGHERNRRSGTLNVPGIVGMGKALEIAENQCESEIIRLENLRNRLENSLMELPNVQRNGHPSQRLTHVSNLAFEGVDSEGLIMKMRKIAVATGSACTSASMEPSHVLQAMGLSKELAHASIRFSLGRFTTSEEIDVAIEEVRKAVSAERT